MRYSRQRPPSQSKECRHFRRRASLTPRGPASSPARPRPSSPSPVALLTSVCGRASLVGRLSCFFQSGLLLLEEEEEEGAALVGGAEEEDEVGGWRAFDMVAKKGWGLREGRALLFGPECV